MHRILEELLLRYPALRCCGEAVNAAVDMLLSAYRAGGKVLVCGNGGSAADAERISWLMPIFAYVWFLVISIPTGVLSGRIGRKNAVMVSLAVTVAAMVVPLFANAERWYLYVAAFALALFATATPIFWYNIRRKDERPRGS